MFSSTRGSTGSTPCPRGVRWAPSSAACGGCSRSTASACGPSTSAPPSPSPMPGSARPSADGDGYREDGRRSQIGEGRLEHGVEDVLREHGSFPAYAGRVDPQHSVEPDLAWTTLRVPGAGADVHPLPAVA